MCVIGQHTYHLQWLQQSQHNHPIQHQLSVSPPQCSLFLTVEVSTHNAAPSVNRSEECNNNCLSVGLATGIAVAISLLVVLPVGVVIGCCGMLCLLKTSIRQEDLPGNIYDVPSLTHNTLPPPLMRPMASANRSRNSSVYSTTMYYFPRIRPKARAKHYAAQYLAAQCC